MTVDSHPHALARLGERGATKEEVVQTVTQGESFPVKYGRTGFRRNFTYGQTWRGKIYDVKQIEAITVYEDEKHLVITVLVRYFSEKKG